MECFPCEWMPLKTQGPGTELGRWCRAQPQGDAEVVVHGAFEHRAHDQGLTLVHFSA